MTESESKQLRKRRPSFVWPIIIITLGVVFLLSNLGIIGDDIWNQFWRLWPLLFVAVGLDSLFRRNEIAGPVFMIGLGIVILLTSLGMIGWDAWDTLWRLWPVLLVAVGLEIIIGRRSLWISTLAVFVIVAGLGGVLWFFGDGDTPGTVLRNQYVNQPLEDISKGEILIRPAVGELNINGLSDSSALVDGEILAGSSDNVYMDYRLSGNTGILKIDTRSVGNFSGIKPWNWDLGLTNNIPLKADFSMAAGDMDLNLSELVLTRLDVRQAVGEMNISLASQDEYSAEISQAVGSIEVEIPEDVGVRVEINRVISSLSIPSSFLRRGDYYYSADYDNADYKITIKISQAIGSIVLK